MEYFKSVHGIVSSENDDAWNSITEAAGQAVLDAVRARNPNVDTLEGTPFFADARNVALLHATANKLRVVNQRYADADTVDGSYEKKLEILVKAVQRQTSPRDIVSTDWERELYRPYGQDFGVGTDFY